MKTSLIKAMCLAVAFAAPTAAFASSYDNVTSGATLVSAHSANVDHSGRDRKANVRNDQSDRKSETRPAPFDDAYTHWDANMNAG